jgi:hypothetical protein
MKKLFFACILFFAVACGSGNNKETNADTTTSLNEGNSAGEEIIAMDTLRMDTSSHSISTP